MKKAKLNFSLPNFGYEQEAVKAGYGRICGVDEAGRGPWAGPVVAAAVVFKTQVVPAGLNDSKKLNHKKREALFAPIMACADVGIGIADVARIDRDNILQATFWAMREAVRLLTPPPDFVLVDGNRGPALEQPVRTIIEGDAHSLSIAAASIIAKVTRDRIMVQLERDFPGYGFGQHKGYGTALHLAQLQRLGVCSAHRTSFAPIARLIRA